MKKIEITNTEINKKNIFQILGLLLLKKLKIIKINIQNVEESKIIIDKPSEIPTIFSININNLVSVKDAKQNQFILETNNELLYYEFQSTDYYDFRYKHLKTLKKDNCK